MKRALTLGWVLVSPGQPNEGSTKTLAMKWRIGTVSDPAPSPNCRADQSSVGTSERRPDYNAMASAERDDHPIALELVR
jgi:hypothetical protein